jgi:hypothetical protein
MFNILLQFLFHLNLLHSDVILINAQHTHRHPSSPISPHRPLTLQPTVQARCSTLRRSQTFGSIIRDAYSWWAGAEYSQELYDSRETAGGGGVANAPVEGVVVERDEEDGGEEGEKVLDYGLRLYLSRWRRPCFELHIQIDNIYISVLSIPGDDCNRFVLKHLR